MIGPTVCTLTWVERALQITTRDFRVQAGLRTHEHQAALVARGASRTMHSRHLTGPPSIWSRWMAARSAGSCS